MSKNDFGHYNISNNTNIIFYDEIVNFIECMPTDQIKSDILNFKEDIYLKRINENEIYLKENLLNIIKKLKKEF